MDKQQKEIIKKEQIVLYEEEIAKTEQAISILKERYQENLVSLEKKLETEKFKKEIFVLYK